METSFFKMSEYISASRENRAVLLSGTYVLLGFANGAIRGLASNGKVR
jgi:hypothetical protein